MIRFWCLAVACLMLGSLAAAAAVSGTQQLTPRSHQADAAQSDGSMRTAMVYCEIKHWISSKCMGHDLFHCDNREDHNCKVVSKCKPYYPAKHCAA
jgi:hypothetical protein